MLSPGDLLAGYQIEGYVARGGMAVVYRARDLSLGRRVALKLIAPELATNDKFRQRFIRESELAASIDHPNVLPIYAAGESEGVLYIAMRYVDGADLGHVIADAGRLDPAAVLPMFTQVAAALDTAHAHGLIHRDVKPGNILVARMPGEAGESHVYLTDFGLTKRSTSLSGFTTAGHFIGTIAYVAPEQIAGREVTRAADVYAMGCVLYEALSGMAPFQRDDDAAMLWAHMSSMPQPLAGFVPGIPEAVDEVIARAMAKDPQERTESCRAVIAQLREAFRSGYSPIVPGPEGSARLPGPWNPVTPPESQNPAGYRDSSADQEQQPAAPGNVDGWENPAVQKNENGVRPEKAEESAESPSASVPIGQRRPPADSMDDQPGMDEPLFTAPAPGAGLAAAEAAEELNAVELGGQPADGKRRTRSRATAKSRSRRAPWIIAAVAVGALLASAFVVLPRWLQPEFVSYSGEEKSTPWLAFDRPTDWSPHSNLSKTCFCTNQYGAVLESGDWGNVIAAIKDGTSVEGLYAEQSTRLDLEDASAVSDHLKTFLAENKKDLEPPVRTTVDNRSAWLVEGTLVASKDPTLRLTIRYLMVMSATGQKTDQIVLFTRDRDYQNLSKRLDRVQNSLRFLENG